MWILHGPHLGEIPGGYDPEDPEHDVRIGTFEEAGAAALDNEYLKLCMDLIFHGVNEDAVFMMSPEEVKKASEDFKETTGNQSLVQGSSSSTIAPIDHADPRTMDDEQMKDFLRSRGKSNRSVCNMKMKRLRLEVNAIIAQEKRSAKRMDLSVFKPSSVRLPAIQRRKKIPKGEVHRAIPRPRYILPKKLAENSELRRKRGLPILGEFSKDLFSGGMMYYELQKGFSGRT